MLGRTHALIGAMATLSLIGPFVPHVALAPLLVSGAVGALLPDLDSPRSLLTAWQVVGIAPLRPLSRIINRTFGHRGALHSLLGWGVATVAFLALAVLPLWNIAATLALSLGYLSHLGADACTKTGIPFLYPRRQRYRLLPGPLRFSTASLAEEVLFTILLLLFCCQLIIVLFAP